MLKKFKHIVLIDDDETINYYHNYIIEKCNLADKVFIVTDIKDAFELLNTLATENQTCTGLIFFDFKILKHKEFEIIKKNKALLEKLADLNYRLFILTTHSKGQDIDQNEVSSIINEYIQKPITVDTLKRLQDTYL